MTERNKGGDIAPVNAIDGPVDEALVGEVWPSAQPGEDAVLYGHVELTPRDPVEVRSLQTFRLTYTVGRYGLDDTGAIRIVFRRSPPGNGHGDSLGVGDLRMVRHPRQSRWLDE